MRKQLIGIVLALAVSMPAWGFSSAKLNVDMRELEGQADEVVEVNLEGKSLEQGSRLLAIRDGIGKSFRGLLGGLKGIYRKTYRFAAGKSYEAETVSKIRDDIAGEGWAPMIDVQDREKNQSVTVYSYTENEAVMGVTVVSNDPGEVTVVNIVGDVDLEALAEFGETFGIPSMRIATTELGADGVTLPPAPKPE